MITITVVTITMIVTMFAFYFGQYLGRNDKVEVIGRFYAHTFGERWLHQNQEERKM